MSLWAVAIVQLVSAFFWDVMPRHWVIGAGRAETTESTEDAAIVVMYVLGDWILCAVQNSKCWEVWYGGWIVGKFGTRNGVWGTLVRGSECGEVWYGGRSVGKFGTWMELMEILRRKEKHISILKRNKVSCNSQ